MLSLWVALWDTEGCIHLDQSISFFQNFHTAKELTLLGFSKCMWSRLIYLFIMRFVNPHKVEQHN